MRIGVLGTGAAGGVLEAREVETQAEAAAHAEVIVNACSGAGTLAALGNAGEQNRALAVGHAKSVAIGHVNFNVKLVR